MCARPQCTAEAQLFGAALRGVLSSRGLQLDQNCCATNSPVGPPRQVCFTPTATAPRCPGNIPVASYLDEPANIRHLGPMAQDFMSSFGLGNDDRSYQAVDGHGVAMAAIQALDRLVTAQKLRIESLERSNRELARRLRAVEARRPTALNRDSEPD